MKNYQIPEIFNWTLAKGVTQMDMKGHYSGSWKEKCYLLHRAQDQNIAAVLNQVIMRTAPLSTDLGSWW